MLGLKALLDRLDFLNVLRFRKDVNGNTVLLGAGGAIMPMLGANTITVGAGGMFSTIADAIAGATARAPSLDARVTILLIPGVHALTASVTIPPYVSLVGLDRDATIISVSGAVLAPLKYTTNNQLRNLRIRYASTVSGTAYALQDSLTGTPDNTWLELDNVNIEYQATTTGEGGCMRLNGNKYVRLNNCELSTSKWGVNVNNANTVHLNNCDIWLTNSNTGTSHIGLRVPSAVRLQVRGGKIATGYGPYAWPANEGIEGEADQHIYGVLATSGASSGGRIELYNVWCIMRNQTGANAGVDTIPVCNQGAICIRVFGGYYQAEDGGASAGDKLDLSNESTGIMQLIGNVACTYVSGTVTGMSGSPGSVRAINSDTNIVDSLGECSGIYLIDSSGGNVTLTLPATPSWHSRIVVKRSSALNVVTLAGNGRNVDGAASFVVAATAYAGATLVYTGSEWLIE